MQRYQRHDIQRDLRDLRWTQKATTSVEHRLFGDRTRGTCVCPGRRQHRVCPIRYAFRDHNKGFTLAPWTAEHLDRALVATAQHKRFTINDIEPLLSAGDSAAGHGISP